MLEDNTPTPDVAPSPTESKAIGLPPLGEPLLPQFTLPPVAGFWRRIVAFFLDGLVLGAAGQAVAWSFSPLWYRIGPYGRLLGFFLALVYFGVLDSRIGRGQTPGKRVLKVALRDATGESIGVGRSMLRTLIWLAPVTLNGWTLPIMSNVVVSGVAGVVLFGVGGAVVLTMVFNRRTRQGIHDLLTHTYVVHTDGWPVEALPVAGRLPWVLAGSALALSIALVPIGGILASRSNTPLQEMLAVQRTLQGDGRFFSTSVMDQSFFEGGGETTRVLRIQVWFKGKPTDAERTAVLNDLAAAALTLDDVDRFDLLRVDVMSAYDLGFASGYMITGEDATVDAWRDRLRGE